MKTPVITGYDGPIYAQFPGIETVNFDGHAPKDVEVDGDKVIITVHGFQGDRVTVMPRGTILYPLPGWMRRP